MRRRRFFQVSTLGALVLACALWGGERLGGRRGGRRLRPFPALPALPGPDGAGAATWTPRCLSHKQLFVLHTAALRIVDGATDGFPEGAERSAAAVAERSGALEQARREDALAATATAGRRLVFIDRYLMGLEVGLRADVRALLELLEHYPLVTGRFARFSRLRADEQDAVLRSWEASRFTLLRQGLQALKSMVLLAHYQDPSSFRAIGYSGPLVGAVPALPATAPALPATAPALPATAPVR
ncbi:MAG: hypothetical protein U1A78_08590 [Polyangia bacterium]